MEDSFDFRKIDREGKSNKLIYFEILNEFLRYATHRHDQRGNEEVQRERVKLKRGFDIDDLDFSIVLGLDTEDAMIEYYRNGLFINQNLGEYNLRLYGILNCISLQFASLIKLGKMFDYDKKVTTTRSKSKIYELRNIIGSHTLDYKTKDENGKEYTDVMCYRNSLALFNKWGEIMLLKSKKNGIKTVNLLNEIDKYNVISEEILKDVLCCVISNTNATDNKSFAHIDDSIKQMNVPFNYKSIIPNRE